MQRALAVIVTFMSLLSCKNDTTSSTLAYKWPEVTPPVAIVTPYSRTLHGDTVTDNYYWMIDYFKKGRDSSKVVQYLEAENQYLDTMMSGTRDFQEKLFSEMKGRIREKDESVPVFKNGYFYYRKTEEGRQYYQYCRKKATLSAPEEVIFDADEMAKGHSYYSAVDFNISQDNKLLAYGVDTVSRRKYVINIKNLETGETFSDAITGTNGTSVWANDNKTLFYTAKNPETLLSEKIMRHTLHSDPARDLLIYYEKDKSNYLALYKSKSDKYIFIHSGGTLSSEARFIDANEPNAAFKVFQPRMKEVLYDVVALDDKFLILTNWKAKNFRLMECPPDKTDSLNWVDVIPHRTDVLISYVEEFKNFLVISERKNGLVQIRMRDLKTKQESYLDFGEPAYTANIGDNPDYNTSTLRYNYSSLTTAQSVFDYNMATKEKKLMKQQEVLGGYTSTDYVTERLYATATDGTKIPVSIVYKKGFKKDGTSPLLLYAYGSYGSSTDASFSAPRLSILNRGFAYAIAHIRGGQEMGREWYENGKMMHKKNTFTDFIDCGKFLVDQKYTSNAHLYAQGGSAGGLLMGAVANMAPDLFHGIIAQVPFVDVVNTMLDESIPLTTNEFDEWGNPKNKEAYIYIKSYSPYENVERKKLSEYSGNYRTS